MLKAQFSNGGHTLPWIDISSQKERHIVIARGTVDLYNGHPTTAMLDDNRTIFCTWSYDHGGKNGFLSVSKDAGLTWEKLQTPKDWKTSKTCPSIYYLESPSGVKRLFIFSAYPKMTQTYSEDEGKTWTPIKSLGKACLMPFTSILKLKDGSYLGMYHRGLNDLNKSPLTLWQSISSDGGITWGESTLVGEKEGKSPCEPFVFRSPDGKRLLCVARENQRKGNSLIMFSNNEGKSWSELQEVTWGLTGDRHIIKYAPDGRIVAVFRDMAIDSPTKGHFVAWIGTYNDIINGYSGQYRIKLMHNYASQDCGYSGLEILKDGTIIATTYIKYNPGEEKHSIVATRFSLKEMDRIVSHFK